MGCPLFNRLLALCRAMLILSGMLLLLVPVGAGAHDALGAYVQHRVEMSVGAQHIDVTFDLTFFEDWSARERRLMDSDTNGFITHIERVAYVKGIAAQVAKQVGLRVGGREISLTPLYEPELDLLAEKKPGPAHHKLRLVFFAATPEGLRPGDSISVEDRLWRDAPIIVTTQAGGQDGCRLKALPVAPAFYRSAEGRRLDFECLTPPAKEHTAVNQQ